jgi:hypothetical protein
MMLVVPVRLVHSVSFRAEVFVQYTISSRGRPIGTTELDFGRIDGSSRSGWFHPNALGEELMPTVALAIPAMRAYLCRDMRDADGQPIVQQNLRRSSLFADLAEALHRVDAMELSLHRPNGSLIPTSLIGIQDTEQLRGLAGWQDWYPVGEVPSADEEWVQELARELEEPVWDRQESDDELLDGAVEDGWAPDEEATNFPRYQVHLVLREENAIP